MLPPVGLRGPSLDILGGGGEFFCLTIFIYFTREIESFIFVHLRIGWKYLFQYLYLIIFISTSFVDKIFISTMPCGHLFILPIFPTKIFISIKLQPPSPKYSNGGP